MMKRFAALAAIAAVTITGHAQAADAEAGEKVYRKCKACHVLEEETNRVGPHLVGIVGRPVASADGFGYSDAMKSWGEGKTWTPELLKEYLAAPKDAVPGNKMAFPGLKKAEDLDNIVAYLEAEAGS